MKPRHASFTDKKDLFRAAIWRANQQASEDLKQRITADPEGGLPHRLWMHSMLAALANPLVAAQIRGQSDLFQGLMGTFDQKARSQLVGHADTYVTQLQQAGLIRTDLPVPALSDLIRRWLEPEQLPSDTTAGKQALGEWLEHFTTIEGQHE